MTTKTAVIVPDKELPKIIERAKSYIEASIDILMHEQIISIIEELKQFRQNKKP